MSLPLELLQSFTGAFGTEEAWEGDPDDLSDALEEGLRQAHRHGPRLSVSDDVFLVFVAQRLNLLEPDALRALHWGDLWVAFGCALGESPAVEALERSYMPQVTAALRRMSAPSQQLDDMLQVVRQQLVAEGRIAEYGGRGPLQAWLRVAAVRAVIKLGRKGYRELPSDEEAMFDGTTSSDPELLLIKQTYRASFKQAFQDALDNLAPFDRLVLQQYVVDRLTVDDLARLHRVHRATAARWVSKSRETLVAETRRRFAATADWSATECASVMKLIESNLDATILRRIAADKVS